MHHGHAIHRTSRALSRAALSVLCMIAALATGAESFELSRVTISGGGIAGTSGSTRLRGSTTGEAGPVGFVSATGGELGLGFWAPFLSASSLTDVPAPAEEVLPAVNMLRQNQPNPFPSTTTIAYAVAAPAAVELAVFDVTGRRLATLVAGAHDPGFYQAQWDGADDRGREASSGIYYYRLSIDSWSATRRMLKLR